jgi:glycosyltransferase involved in cell wall biosynthesis
MNVLFDISLLGSAHYYRRHRTGIARAIENLLDSLTTQNDCRLSFCAYNNLEQFIQSSAYLLHHPGVADRELCKSGSRVLDQLTRFASMVYPESVEGTSQKVRRRITSFFLKRVTLLQHSLDPASLARTDIFHATFYPLPEYVESTPTLQRFLTVYDMIPVLFPDYFEPQIIRNFNNIIKSIRPDDWVLAISESTKNDFCAWTNFDPARVFVTPLAASKLFYHCTDPVENNLVRKRYGIPDGPYALSLCTLEPRKNIDHTIRCFVKTIREQRIPDLNLVLVGTKGWDFDRIFAEIANADDIRERIIVTGYVPDEDLASLYSEAMMFVYPSLYEGFGLPLLEAMQCGVPVITSNSSSLPEVVGSAGLMVSPTDGDALCQAFWDLYRKSELRGELSRKSLERAELFSWNQCAADTVAAYRVATAGRRV